MTSQVIRIPDDSDPDRPYGLDFTSPRKTPLTLPHLYPQSPSEDENSMILSIVRKADFFPTNNRELKAPSSKHNIICRKKRTNPLSAHTHKAKRAAHTSLIFLLF